MVGSRSVVLVAARFPLAVGVVEWPGGAAATLVVKRTFDLVAHGAAPPSSEQSPLRVDAIDASGRLLFPTDFAPLKSACDVGVVGTVLAESRGPVRIVAGPVRVQAAQPAGLAPRAGVGTCGDPTEAPSGDWATPGFDPDPFQWSRAELRSPPATFPLHMVVDLGPDRFRTRIAGPAPEALLLDVRGWNAPEFLALRADGLAFDLARRRVEVVWRATVKLIAGAEPLLVVEASAPLRQWKPREMLEWPRADALEPRLLRRAALQASLAPASSRVTLTHAADEDLVDDGTTTMDLSIEALPPRAPSRVARPPSGEEAVRIQPLGHDDIDRCMDLAERVAWPRERAKWELIFSLGPGFGVVGPGGALSAMVAFPRHEGISFVAMMAVDPREQGKGLGRALLDRAMHEVGQPLMLYATEEGRPLYERLGFREVDRATKHFGTPRPRLASSERNPVRPATPQDHEAIIDADARGYGVRRSALVRALLARAERVVVDDRGGFAIRWSNGHVAVVGPVAAASEDAAIALVDGATEGAAGGVRIDVALGSPRVAAHVRARGLETLGESPLMTWKLGALPGDRATYHALALQAFG